MGRKPNIPNTIINDVILKYKTEIFGENGLSKYQFNWNRNVLNQLNYYVIINSAEFNIKYHFNSENQIFIFNNCKFVHCCNYG